MPRAPKGHTTINGKVHPNGKHKEGPIICPWSNRRIPRLIQFSLGTLYDGKTATCPECNGNVRLTWDKTTRLAWTWGKHARGDREVRGGKIVSIPQDASGRTADSPGQPSEAGF